MAVKTETGGGGSPDLHDQREEGWGDRRFRPDPGLDPGGGLGLDGLGVADPMLWIQLSARTGWPNSLLRKGWKPEGPRPLQRARFTRARPGGYATTDNQRFPNVATKPVSDPSDVQ